MIKITLLKKIQRVKLPVTRTKDNRKSNCDYRSALLVVCPHCASPAWSFILTESHRWVTCIKCGFSKTFLRTGCRYYGNSSFSLFLAIPCLGNTLWAYNPQQLAELKEWVQADLREREKDSTWGWSNQSYFSRLPRWLKLAKNFARYCKIRSFIDLK